MPDPEIVNPLPKPDPIAVVKAEIVKGLTYLFDYKFYLVSFVIFVAGAVMGYHLHK